MPTKKYKFNLAIILPLLCFAFTDAYGQSVQTQRRMPETRLPEVRFPGDKNVVEVPFEAEGNHIVIPVSVNGSRPLRFVFDTGAPTAVLNNSAIADSLNLKITGTKQVRGAGGGGASFEVKVAGDVKFIVGGIELSNGNMSILPSPLRGHDGVIGSPLFATTVVEIDWEKKVVRFYEPAKYKYSGSGSVLPLTFDQRGVPYTTASVTIEGEKTIPVKLVVDTGGSHYLFLESGSNAEIKPPAGAAKTSLGRGASGEITGYTGRVKNFQIGNYSIKDAPTGFPDASGGTALLGGRDGNLGGGVLRRFKIIYDYSRKQMIVEPNKFINDPFGIPIQNIPTAAFEVAPATLPDYVGKYGNKEISVKDGGLYYQRIGGSGAQLRPTGKDKFALNNIAQIIFVRDGKGVVTEMTLEWVDRDKEQFKREPLANNNEAQNQQPQSQNVSNTTPNSVSVRKVISGSEQSAVDAQTKEQLKTIMAYLLEDIYVIPENGKKIAQQMRAEFESDAYKNAATPAELAQMLTQDLREIGKDKHLYVRYDAATASESATTILTPQEWDKQKPSVFPKRASSPQLMASPQLSARMAEELRQANYNFREAKYLDGNIGYINMGFFTPGEEAREAADKTIFSLYLAAIRQSESYWRADDGRGIQQHSCSGRQRLLLLGFFRSPDSSGFGKRMGRYRRATRY